VNNAGISSQGESLNFSLDTIHRMVQVNAMSVMTLMHLFGTDMKKRRRGRILMVSSICGAVEGIASVAVYSATKAFENSFGTSLGKELEPHGVGVTCLMPGAVSGTEFRERSQSQEALCWKIPFYAKTAPGVASQGVLALLRGDTDCTPGVMNRVFMKVAKPIMPQRLHNLVAEIMWNPLNLPFLKRVDKPDDANGTISVPSIESDELVLESSQQRPPSIRTRSYNYKIPRPNVLELKSTYVPELIEPERQSEAETLLRVGATSENEAKDSGDAENNEIKQGPVVEDPNGPVQELPSKEESVEEMPTEQEHAQAVEKSREGNRAYDGSADAEHLLRRYERSRLSYFDDMPSFGHF
jgi:short chain dehydrogenase